MTLPARSTVNDVRQWLTLALTLGNLTLLVGGFAWWGRGLKAQDDALRAALVGNEREDVRHHSNGELHMPFQTKVELFVSRNEWNKQLATRDGELERMREQLNKGFDGISEELRRMHDELTAVKKGVRGEL